MADSSLRPDARVQDLRSFKLPAGFRGRSALVVQLWFWIRDTVFLCSPQPLYAWRRWLLILFGAKIGRGVQIRPTARVTYPWKLTIGDDCWIGDFVELYTLGEITIGHNSCISQNSYICAATHDHLIPSFDMVARPICIGSEVWVAADVFVGPGVTIGDGALIGARSTLLHDAPPRTIMSGFPARPRGTRAPAGAS